jgi:carbohydrate-binding DOMON domain-containing protein
VPVWEYGQLTITTDVRTEPQARAILWQEPRGQGGDLSDSEQTVFDLLNQLGADGWELAGVEEDRQGGNRGTDWGAVWSMVIYTFKRPAPELHAV